MVTTPATTVSGVAADMTKKTTAGTPSRSAANAVDTLLGRRSDAAVCRVGDIEGSLEVVDGDMGYVRALSTASPTAAAVSSIRRAQRRRQAVTTPAQVVAERR